MDRRFFLVCAVLLLAAVSASDAQAGPNRLMLTIDKGPAGDLELSWQDSCQQAGTDYGIYEGDLGVYTTHRSIHCGTGGASTMTVSPSSGNAYYLVVPLEGGAEGSYGLDGSGSERPVGLALCSTQQVVNACLDDNFVDASPERLARLDAVLDAASTIIESGGTYTDVANMLAGESDVSGVSSNGVSMYFTVGGLSTTIYDTVAARHGGPLNDIIPPANPAPASIKALASNPIPASAVQPLLPRGQRMVGKDDDGDGFRDLPKHALILSPWSFDFVPNDSAPMVNTILNGVRDYQEGSVTFKANNTDLIQGTMLISDYTGWEDKDIIFVSSHGDADPNAAWGPDPYIFLGIGGASCTDIALKILAEVPDSAMRPGLRCSFFTTIGPSSNKITGRDTLGTRAFWEYARGGKLEKKLIYMDACRTAFHPGLAEALTGTDSIFLGWSEYVQVSKSLASADAVIRETVVDGFPVLRSFVHECSGGACIDGSTPPAELLAAWDRADLRTREALSIPATPLYAGCAVSPTLPVSDTCPSCVGGFPMSMSFNISLEGVEPAEMVLAEDPLEFGRYQLRLFADIDGIESGYAQPLYDVYMTPTGNGTYIDAFGMTLFMDNICPNQVIEYNPWVLLPTFDESMPGNDARDRIYSWDGPFTMEIVPEQFP